MQKTWKAPDYERGSIRKVLVIGVFKAPGARETVEGQFVQQLQEERLEAVARHAYLSDTELSRDTIVQKVQELNFDGVVLSRAIDRQTFEKYYGPDQEKAEFPVGYYDECYKQYVENVESRDAIGYTVDSALLEKVSGMEPHAFKQSVERLGKEGHRPPLIPAHCSRWRIRRLQTLLSPQKCQDRHHNRPLRSLPLRLKRHRSFPRTVRLRF